MPCILYPYFIYFAFALIKEKHDCGEIFHVIQQSIAMWRHGCTGCKHCIWPGICIYMEGAEIVDLWLIRQTIEDIISCKVDTSSINMCDTTSHCLGGNFFFDQEQMLNYFKSTHLFKRKHGQKFLVWVQKNIMMLVININIHRLWLK